MNQLFVGWVVLQNLGKVQFEGHIQWLGKALNSHDDVGRIFLKSSEWFGRWNMRMDIRTRPLHY